MTVEQMHWEVNLGLQRIASYVYDIVKPAELDRLLTKNMLRFMEQKYMPQADQQRLGFSRGLKRMADLQALHKTAIIPFLVSPRTNRLDAWLPWDFYYPVEAELSRYYDCKVLDKSIFVQTTIANYYTITFPEVTSPTSFETIVIDHPNIAAPLYDGADYTDYLTGLVDPEEVVDVISHIIYEINRDSGWEAYWERWRDIYVPGKLILVAPTDPGPANLTLTYKAVETIATKAEKSLNKRVPTETAVEIPARFVHMDNIKESLRHPFQKTHHDSPVVELSDNYLRGYENEKFVLVRAYLQYIRNPQIISLPLSQDCELPVHTHQSVVDATVAHIKLLVESQAAQMSLLDKQQTD